ncbi:TRAP transporter small permease [Paracoccus salsus]|uniref:TRAP transporter small permease n=1 Tax=Paracoccus salsus TaxID=2911061 RepID=UPI001F3F162B|nr:TRAP transporter small permease [Paracoccus salsus]MCF3972224.1 TRAP transporter small permease [Paracoccus salsus]
MVEQPTEHAHPVPLPGWLTALCRIFAGIGGMVLLAMMLMTVTSVARRSLLGAPIPGDFELVEIGTAIAIFCFLPWCQSTGGNVLVDFFTQTARPRSNHLLEALGDLIYLLIAALLLWRMVQGGMEMRQYGEQSMVLRIPVWWSFLLILPAMALLVVTTGATLAGHLRMARA